MKTSFQTEFDFHSITIKCPVCGGYAFISQIPELGNRAKADVESDCPHFKFSINEERYALDVGIVSRGEEIESS